MQELGYKILNIICWQKTDAKPTLSRNYFDFTTEYIIWARKDEKHQHFFNCDLMEQLNGVDGTGLTWQRVCTTNDTDIHVTTSDKTKWNEVDKKANVTDLTTHTSNKHM